MPTPSTTFLKNPAAIRKAVKGLQGEDKLDLAVAFVGADWQKLLADFRGKLRLVCWLSSTNTDPGAVEGLMSRPNTEVRQRDSMHCKVYLSPNVGAVVGSANLSKAALTENENAGQHEAAVLVTVPSVLAEIESWFEGLWQDNNTRPIERFDLAAARISWDKARQARLKSFAGIKTQRSRSQTVSVPTLPADFDPKILAYAKQVRSLDLREVFRELNEFIESIKPESLTEEERQSIVDHLVQATKHRSAYKNFLARPISNVSTGLSLLFDDSLDVQSRLEDIQREGYLSGLRMPSLSLLLCWWKPERFPPYDFRTMKFLRDFHLEKKGMSASSARCYVTWLGWAEQLAQRLNLPTRGHVDRMVDQHYTDHDSLA